MTEKFLRDQLVGAWELTSFIERDIATGVENHPFGKHPQGLILYTPDGYVSAQLQRPERPPFADEDLLHATPDEYAAAGRSYVAYSGRFFVDERKKSLSHEIAVSFFPNWLGQRQVRVVTPCRGAATRQGGGKRDNVPKKSEQSMMDPRKPSHRASV